MSNRHRLRLHAHWFPCKAGAVSDLLSEACCGGLSLGQQSYVCTVTAWMSHVSHTCVQLRKGLCYRCHTTEAAPCREFCSRFRSVGFGGWGLISGNCHLTTVVNTVSAPERACWFIKRWEATSWEVLSSPWTGGGRLTFQSTIEQEGIPSATLGLVTPWVPYAGLGDLGLCSVLVLGAGY